MSYDDGYEGVEPVFDEPPPDPPRVLATFSPLASPTVTATLIDHEGSLVLVCERTDDHPVGYGKVTVAVELDGFADVLIGPLLDRLARDAWLAPGSAAKAVIWQERILIAGQILAPVLERPTDEGDDPEPDPF